MTPSTLSPLPAKSLPPRGEGMKIRIPDSVEPLKDEPVFSPERHLQLEAPSRIWTLKEFGYSDADIAKAISPLAVTAPFRILSDEGVTALRSVLKRMEGETRQNERTARYLRGSVYRSSFIRSLSESREVNDFVSGLAGIGLLPHPMALYQAHINMKPTEAGRDVDRWHTDTVAMDYIILVTQRDEFEGGNFEYLQCTKAKAIRSLIREEETPHIVKVDFPKAGYAVLQQGNMVVHRGSAVTRGDERTTFVQSFIPDDPDFAEVSKLDDCKLVDPPEILFTEWARYKAFLSSKRLGRLMETLPYTTDKNLLCAELRRAIRDVEEAIMEITDPSEGRLVHYDQDALTDGLK